MKNIITTEFLLLTRRLAYSETNTVANKTNIDGKTNMSAKNDLIDFYVTNPNLFLTNNIFALLVLRENKTQLYNNDPATYNFGKGICYSNNLTCKEQIQLVNCKKKAAIQLLIRTNHFVYQIKNNNE